MHLRNTLQVTLLGEPTVAQAHFVLCVLMPRGRLTSPTLTC